VAIALLIAQIILERTTGSSCTFRDKLHILKCCPGSLVKVVFDVQTTHSFLDRGIRSGCTKRTATINCVWVQLKNLMQIALDCSNVRKLVCSHYAWHREPALLDRKQGSAAPTLLARKLETIPTVMQHVMQRSTGHHTPALLNWK